MWQDDEETHFRLSFTFFEDSKRVYYSNQKISGDCFSVNKDLTWSYDADDMGEIKELTPEFKSWLDEQDTQECKLAVLAVAVAKAWLEYPPNQSAGMDFDTQGPWAH
jgi:hypothetical protein